MILDVHVTFLIASLSVLFGLTYSINRILDYKIAQIKKARQTHNLSENMAEGMTGNIVETIANSEHEALA